MGIGAIAISSYFLLVKKEDSAESPIAISSPASQFALSELEILDLEKKAISGDCAAAQKLSEFHANLSLKFNEAIKWGRTAAKCPSIRPKEALIALLSQIEGDPNVLPEINELISQIVQIDQREATRIKKSVDDYMHSSHETQTAGHQ